jgi:diguanylate cyclase (GGDEF)-like protein
MFGRKRRIEEATAVVREGYDKALVDAGVILFQQVAPGVDGYFVSTSMVATLGWDAAAFRQPGTLRNIVHADDLALFRSVAPVADVSGLPETTIDLRGSFDIPPPPLPPTPGVSDDEEEPVVRFLTSAGTYRPMVVRMVRTEPGEPVRGSLIDAAPGSVPRQRARRLAEIAEMSHHGHLLFELLDRDDPSSVVFRAANDAARRLFELDASVLDGGRLDAVFDGPSARLLQSALYDVAQTGESLTAERLTFAEVPGTFVDLRIDRLHDGSLGVTIDDVTRAVDVEERLRHQASHDHLTGLPNRAALDERLSLVAAGLEPGQYVAVVLVDVDGLDEVNRQLGHHVGDQLLVELGRRLREDVVGVELVARVGGDEFAVVTAPYGDRGAALDRARLVEEVVQRPLDVDGDLRHIGCTIGAAVAPEHGMDPGTLLRAADGALRQARAAADPVAVFDPVEERTTMRRIGLLTELRRGLANQQLELRYQPVVDLRTGRVTKVEAMLRWQRVGNGAQLSVELLEMAERSGLIEPLTRWVLGESARAAERLSRDRESMVVSTNMSMRNLRNDDLLSFVDLLVASGELPPSTVEIELSEKELTDDPTRSQQVVQHLRELGLGVVVDEFGTGFMSIDSVKALPVTGLKIDRGYTTAISAVPADAEAVEWAIGVAHSMAIPVTADGVADADSLVRLTDMGCDMAQGLHLSEPVTFEALPGRVAELEEAMLGWVGTRSVVLD